MITPATPDDFHSTQVFSELIQTSPTPGQTAAIVSVLALDDRKQSVIARSLNISRQRFHMLRAKILRRLAK